MINYQQFFGNNGIIFNGTKPLTKIDLMNSIEKALENFDSDEAKGIVDDIRAYKAKVIEGNE